MTYEPMHSAQARSAASRGSTWGRSPP